jgi:hypothetical protein
MQSLFVAELAAKDETTRPKDLKKLCCLKRIAFARISHMQNGTK